MSLHPLCGLFNNDRPYSKALAPYQEQAAEYQQRQRSRFGDAEDGDVVERDVFGSRVVGDGEADVEDLAIKRRDIDAFRCEGVDVGRVEVVETTSRVAKNVITRAIHSEDGNLVHGDIDEIVDLEVRPGPFGDPAAIIIDAPSETERQVTKAGRVDRIEGYGPGAIGILDDVEVSGLSSGAGEPV